MNRGCSMLVFSRSGRAELQAPGRQGSERQIAQAAPRRQRKLETNHSSRIWEVQRIESPAYSSTRSHISVVHAAVQSKTQNQGNTYFMVQTICDIKNNKRRPKEETVQLTRIRKWLQKQP
ncbi:unnamed protein product [Cuscuta europaea]|uniref:Uncharacterized protein n=1 Tax=Cuscuta europaea TaxID=41803 RepID=A0A9P1EIR0_CUSEU|nr:unnamed protein product [Cuscuta europaea]